MKIVRTMNYVYDALEDAGLNEESIHFEDLLRAIVGAAIQEKEILAVALAREETKNGAYGEARDQTQIFMDWKCWAEGCAGVKDFAQLVGDIVKGAKEIADGVSAAGTSGPCSGSADGEEPACDPDSPGDGVTDRGRAGTQAGAAEAELLGERAENREVAASWLAGAAAFRFESERGDDLGVSGEGPGEAPHEAGCVEGRKKSWEGLPPMSEYRTSLYAQGVCR